MKTKIIVSVVCIVLNVYAYAQQDDVAEYRSAVKELIKTNWETKSCFALVVAGLLNLDSFVEIEFDAIGLALRAQDDAKKNLWVKYHDQQFVDDQTDLFMEFCQQRFTLSEVKQLTNDLSTVKNLMFFTDNKAQIVQNFEKSVRPYLKGEFQGFEEPECSESYKRLCERFYMLLGMQKVFDQNLKDLLKQPVYERHKADVKAYYEENEKVFFLRICSKNLSEQNLKDCLEYMSAQPSLYDALVEISDKNSQIISKIYREKFIKWMKEEEPGIFEALNDWGLELLMKTERQRGR